MNTPCKLANFSIGLVTECSINFSCRCQLHLDHCKDTIYLILLLILPIVSDGVFCAHQTAGHWPNWCHLPPSYRFSFRDFPWFYNSFKNSALLYSFHPVLQILEIIYSSYISTSFPLRFLFPFSFTLLYLEILFSHNCICFIPVILSMR